MGTLSQFGDYFRTRDNGVTVSFCAYCHQLVAAGKEPKTVEIAEKVHDCPSKHEANESDECRNV